MTDVFVMLGFYAERPHGDFQTKEEKAKVRDTELRTIFNINARCTIEEVPRTFFILGDFLAQAKDSVPLSHLEQVFWTFSPLVDLEQHAYSHKVFVPLPTRPDVQVLSPWEIVEEIRETKTLIYRLLPQKSEPIGLGAPQGYSGGLRHAPAGVIDAIVLSGIKFISSDMRDSHGGLNAPLVEDGKLRQPFRYEWTNLWELPTHGWQDTAFTGKSKTLGTEGYPTTLDGIAEHYLALVRQAVGISRSEKKDIYLGLCWQPWAIAQYDPGLIGMKKVIRASKGMGAKFLSYRGAYQQLRNSS